MSTSMIRLALLLLATMLPAVAGPTTCRATTSGISFGRVEALHRRTAESVGEVVLTCEGGAPAKVSVALLAHSDPVSQPRGATVRLYLDAAMRVPWGDGNAGTAVLQRVVAADGRPVHVPVYARLDVTADAPSGSQVRNLTILVTSQPGSEERFAKRTDLL